MENNARRPVLIGVLGMLNSIVGLALMLASFKAPRGDQGGIVFGIGVLAIVVGIGLFQLRPWARKIAIGSYVVNLITWVAQANLGFMFGASLGLTYLLFNRKVKEAFTREPSIAPEILPSIEGERYAA